MNSFAFWWIAIIKLGNSPRIQTTLLSRLISQIHDVDDPYYVFPNIFLNQLFLKLFPKHIKNLKFNFIFMKNQFFCEKLKNQYFWKIESFSKSKLVQGEIRRRSHDGSGWSIAKAGLHRRSGRTTADCAKKEATDDFRDQSRSGG